MNFDEIKSTVLPMVYDPSRIDEVLEDDILHWIYHGLIVVLYVLSNETNPEPMVITNRMVTENNLDEDELFKQAVENINRNYFISYLKQVEGSDPKVLLIRSKNKLFGAGVLVSTKALDNLVTEVKCICDDMKDDTIVILPTSIHDLLVLPYVDILNLDVLEEMVIDINKVLEDPREKLLDGIFTYSLEDHDLKRYYKEESHD